MAYKDYLVDIPQQKVSYKKAFDPIKSELDFERFRPHSTQSTEGKFFIAL